MKYTHEQWNLIFEEQKQSGKSCAAFCRERGIDEKRFFYHRRRWSSGAGTTYTPVKPVQVEPIEISVGDDITLRVPAAQLRTVLDVLCN